MTAVDDDFRGLPLHPLADAALQVARDAGAGHADARVQRVRTGRLALRDARLAGDSQSVDSGFAVRVLLDGVWGFAATDELSTDAAVSAARQALEVARMSGPLCAQPVRLADEPVHAGAEWVSSYRLDPFGQPAAERAGLLADWSEQLLAADAVNHVEVGVRTVKEQKFYADLAGTSTLQQRVMVEPDLMVVSLGPDGPETMRSLAPPSQRGWEYLLGEGWDWTGELAELPELVAERHKAPSMVAGVYDLVIEPTQLWLTIHESVGHATELDRVLGYEAAYAGTSFVRPDSIGTLRYGSDLMHVTGDRTIEHGCGTIGFDDEGVAARQWPIVEAGLLVGVQLDRAMAAQQGLGASNGCAYADSARHVPVQRMANVSLQPQAGGPDAAGLIADVEDGLYVVGDKSWSIDQQRYNFQFTAQRFYRITGGRLAGQVKDAAYQGSTPAFWASLAGVGGPATFLLGGTGNCGKAQPGQGSWAAHGAPTTLFRGVRVLNTREEGAA